MVPQKVIRKSKMPHNTCPSKTLHAHPLMIVGIDTIASDDDNNRGTGGEGGGWGEIGVDCGAGRILKYERHVMYACK
jgi:hypothetical protein